MPIRLANIIKLRSTGHVEKARMSYMKKPGGLENRVKQYWIKLNSIMYISVGRRRGRENL